MVDMPLEMQHNGKDWALPFKCALNLVKHNSLLSLWLLGNETHKPFYVTTTWVAMCIHECLRRQT